MEGIEQFAKDLMVQDGNMALTIQIFAVVFITLLIDFTQRFISRRVSLKVAQSKQYWDDAFHHAFNPPASILIWILGLSIAAEIALMPADELTTSVITAVRSVGVIFALTWFILRLINSLSVSIVAQARTDGKELDGHTVEAITKLVRLSVVITAALMGLQTLGISISGLLAFGGMGGIAVGFAAKDLLANFFGGLMIYLDRPFKVGDWIRSPDRQIEGTVEKIGWRQSVIRTFDKRPLYVPNSTFATIAVENPSRMTNRRIKETIGIRYDDAAKMDVVVRDVKEMLLNHSEIDTSKTLIVNFNSFAPSSLDFFIYTFTKTTNWVKFHEVKQDVLLKIIAIVEGHGAEFAFPTSTILLQNADDMPDPL